MKIKKRSSLLAVLSLLGSLSSAWAASTPTLQNLDSGMVENVFKDFSAGLLFRPVEPASSYGKVWGFSFGAIASLASASRTKNSVPGAGDVTYIPAADIFIGAQFPLGIAFEGGFIPKTSISKASVSRYGGNLKWTITDVFFSDLIPFDVAARVGYNQSEFSFSQTISSIPSQITYKGNMTHFQLGGSKSFFGFLEPYANVGYVSANNELKATGSVTLFNTNLTASQEFSKNYGSLWLNGGLQIKLFVLTISGQYDRVFGTDAFAAKVGFKF